MSTNETLEYSDNRSPLQEQDSSKTVTRRDFLKMTGSFAAAAGLYKSPFKDLLTLQSNESDLHENTEVSFDRVAKSYIALNHEEAEEVSNSILLRNDASPSNICGPLAMSILMQWELNENNSVSKLVHQNSDPYRAEGTIPPDMWLGTPEVDSTRYRIAFPPDQYNQYHIEENIGRVDFDNIPDIGTLEVGDFIFLNGGSFTHYIAISKKDKQGRVYCVSNLHSEEEKDKFLIDEVMLWDPDKKDGYLRNWATGVGVEGAKTGTTGFYLWRRKKAAETQSYDPLLEKYRNEFLNMMREKDLGGEWGIEIYEIGKGELFEWRKNIRYHAASTIKAPLSVLALKLITENHKQELAESSLETVLSEFGTGGRTFQQLINAMLVNSEESATEILASYCKDAMNIEEGFDSIGMHESNYEPRKTSQKDMFSFWRSLFKGELLPKEETSYLLKTLNEYTPNDDLCIGRIKKTFPNARQWNKRGTIVENFTTIQDNGFIEIGKGKNKRLFYLGIAGFSSMDNQMSYEQGLQRFNNIIDLLTKYVEDSSEDSSITKTNTELKETPDIDSRRHFPRHNYREAK